MKSHRHLPLVAILALVALGSAAATAESLPPFLLDPDTLDAAAVGAAADKALKRPIRTIVDKAAPSPTGDPHDYISYSRYWWPDPDKPDGLPYIRKDGHHNREQVALGDPALLKDLIKTTQTLAQAWHLEQREDCARRAGEWLRAWFIAPETRMKPELEHAQIRLGHDGNRGSAWGLLDTRSFMQLVDALRMLHGSPAFEVADEQAVQQWFSDYLDWLTHSELGKRELAATNNHGTWLLAQMIAINRYLGRDDAARELARTDFARIDDQFEPDGSQPDELARTDSLSYSVFNLEPQFCVARLAEPLGVDLWNHTSPDGASLRLGLEFLRPYNADPQKWPHPQLKKLKPGFLDPLLEQGKRVWPDMEED